MMDFLHGRGRVVFIFLGKGKQRLKIRMEIWPLGLEDYGQSYADPVFLFGLLWEL
jgi:hypothetical protein